MKITYLLYNELTRKIFSKLKGLKKLYKLKLPETKRSNCEQLYELTSKCRKIFRRFAISSEKLNEFGYSWFSVKTISVD